MGCICEGMRCVVVGAGVSGLSCAIRLLESGHDVEVISDKFSPETVSDVAAAFGIHSLLHLRTKRTSGE